MDLCTGGVDAVPGAMTQPGSQEPLPMEQDEPRGPLTQEEQESWDRSQAAKALELGEALAKQLIADQNAAAAPGTRERDSPGRGRAPNPERMQRRAERA
eukprot:3439594-Heterocapsa_arctica.AAC.1